MRRLSSGLTRSRFFVSVALALVSIAALGTTVLAGVSPIPSSPAGPVYDAQFDFEAGWAAGTNPNGAWTYGWTQDLTGSFTLSTRNHLPSVNNGLQQMWDDPANDAGFTASVARNSGGNYDDGNVTFTAGTLILHPEGNDGHSYAHVIWTAPASGLYAIAATFFSQQNGINVDVHVLVKGIDRFASTLMSNPEVKEYAGRFKLNAGQTVDFAVGPNGIFGLHPGNTGLEATIIKL